MDLDDMYHEAAAHVTALALRNPEAMKALSWVKLALEVSAMAHPDTLGPEVVNMESGKEVAEAVIGEAFDAVHEATTFTPEPRGSTIGGPQIEVNITDVEQAVENMPADLSDADKHKPLEGLVDMQVALDDRPEPPGPPGGLSGPTEPDEPPAPDTSTLIGGRDFNQPASRDSATDWVPEPTQPAAPDLALDRTHPPTPIRDEYEAMRTAHHAQVAELEGRRESEWDRIGSFADKAKAQAPEPEAHKAIDDQRATQLHRTNERFDTERREMEDRQAVELAALERSRPTPSAPAAPAVPAPPPPAPPPAPEPSRER